MKRKLILLAVVVSAFAAGYGVIADAYPWPWPYDRNANYGYWENRFDNAGKYVLAVGGNCTGAYVYWNGQDNCNAIPSWVDSAGEFSSFIIDKYNNGSSTDRVGAAYIILTMIGENRTWPVTVGEQQEFTSRVAAVAPYTWWNFSGFTYNLNSHNQRGTNGVGPNDIALYDDNASGHRAIIFRTSTGEIAYMIKTRCANPIGYNSLEPLPDDLNFNITGDSTVSNPTPAAGNTVTFYHYIENNGPTGTAPTTIWWIAEKTEPAPLTTTGGPAPWGTLAAGERREVNRHDVIIPPTATPGTRFCERVGWDPVNSSGGVNGRGTPACAVVQSVYTLTPIITATVTSGGATIPGNVAEPGDTITFRYSVNNNGGVSQSTACTYRQATWPGNNQSAPVTLFTPAGANCPPNRTFPALISTETATEVVPAASLNTTICRSFTVTPASSTSGAAAVPDQKCVLVAAKPYTRVWGGDVSAGNGLADASGVCTTTTNNNGAIVGWNKRAAGSNSGAGVQFAAFALARITDYASALYDPGGAPSPDGLSFANTGTNIANGDFGGGWGSAPCIPDYYATRPATTLAIPATVASMVTGIYGGSGNVTLGGGSIVNPNNRITVYVDGNVYINGNITYSGTWSVASAPLFELIVRGNIYVDNDVTQLDGVYVAQDTGTPNTGQIITCATGFSELAVNSLYANCNRKLTVNGLFTANRIQLLRTMGSLSQGNTSEPSTAPNIGEVFNYGPAMWIKQPVRESEAFTPDYDAIISLPPIL